MKIKHMTLNYRVDLSPDLYIEYRLDAEGDSIASFFFNEGVRAEFWIENRKKGLARKHYENFVFDATDKMGTVFDVNFYQALKKLRGKEILENMNSIDDTVDCRWLYFKREFFTVIPVLLYWGHASLRVGMEGTGTNKRMFDYAYETGRTQLLRIDGRGGENVDLPYPGETLPKWFDFIDYIISTALARV